MDAWSDVGKARGWSAPDDVAAAATFHLDLSLAKEVE